MSLFIILAVIGFMGYVRFSPSDILRWHTLPQDIWTAQTPWNMVVPQRDGASLRLRGDPAPLLEKLDALAADTPRTERLAGDVATGRITWITRSAFWGFPDFTTAEARADGLYIFARLRFGSHDFGINAVRLHAWLKAFMALD